MFNGYENSLSSSDFERNKISTIQNLKFPKRVCGEDLYTQGLKKTQEGHPIREAYLPTKKRAGMFQKKTLLEKREMLNPRKPVTVYNWSKIKRKLSKQH